ncbi:protein kinase domain-containing protein [Bradymonas sediminis]|uniref:Protein kinase domain-containing protein n=1 Tax=Bradymonas sediminis TaxID=1548548 RepID=A0A2Z4FJG2_9DELT|nr:protein kinase [Bradymonas sediminis]AWV89072.1 hypothetical protein DN745_06875 [Bradymonas sediminis]TDP64465.1 serine/threonine protein kinase [Bradymonas sediminis]
MTVETPQLPQPGDLVGGRFRILEHLGTGGFGTVFKAVQENVGREVALKFLTPGVAEDPINVERFRREAYHVSQLRHPHTITLYDYGQTENGLVFMVLEFLDGEELSEQIQARGAIPAPRAAHIFIQVLKSLTEAHRRGLVHRDLKPENIFICTMFGEQDYVKVLDFGVAKMTLMETEHEDEGEEALTRAGRIFGTPMYMAPEQACAEPITPATDVYALGLLIYEIWTGKPPVTGKNRMEVIHKQIRDPVPEMSPALEQTPLGQVIRRACMKAPERRYQDASEFLTAFVNALHQMRIFPAPAGGTSPEISLTMAVPSELLSADATQVMTPPSELMTHPGHQALDPSAQARTGQRTPAPSPVQRMRRTPKPAKPGELPASLHAQNHQPTPVVQQVSSPTVAVPAEAGAAARPRYQIELVGRDMVLSQCMEIARDSISGRSGQIILIEGESGIGKSRVVRTFLAQTKTLGFESCLGHFRRRALPMEALREALAASWGVSHSERSRVEQVIGQDLRSLGGLTAPEIDFIIDFVRPKALDASQSPTSDSEAGALFARLERVLLMLAERRPFLLALEDVHYADSATISFLEYLAVTLRTQSVPLVVMLSLRPEERSVNSDLEHSLRTINANIGVGFSRIRLKRLRGGELARLLDAILPLQPRLKERIAWLSQGVPLHAIQIIRYLRSEDKLVLSGRRWALKLGSPREINLPPDLMDLMYLRLEQAVTGYSGSADLRALLEWMAVLGMRTPIDLLVNVLAATGDVDVEDLDAALDSLIDEGIIHQAMHRNLVCVEFDSSLLREALLGALSDRWSNRRLHEDAARHKIEFYQEKALEPALVEIAEHWRQAGQMEAYRDTLFEAASRAKARFDTRGARERFRELIYELEGQGDRSDKWVQTHLALAELARHFGEFGLAEEHYRRVLGEDGSEPSMRPEHAEALRGFAHLLFLQRRNNEALHCYRRALKVSQNYKDVAGVSKALVGLSRVYLMRGDAREGAKVRDHLEQMLPHLPPGETAGRVLLHLAEVAQRQGKLGARYGYLVRARDQLDDSADRRSLSNVLLALGSSLMDPAMNAPDRMQRAEQVLREGMEIKRSVGDRHGVAEAYRHLGQLELEQANYPAAQQLLEQSLTIHQALGAPFNIGATHNSLAIACLYRGEFSVAEEHCDRAIELFERINDQIAVSHVMLNKAIVLLNRCDIRGAQRLLRESRRIKEALGSNWALFDLRNYLAISAMWLGDFEQAEQVLEETLRGVDEHGTDEDRTIARSLNGLLAAVQGRLQVAAVEFSRARQDADELGINRVSAFCHANTSVYAYLNGDQVGFDSLVNAVVPTKLYHMLHREIWLSFVENIVHHAVQQGRDAHAARLLRCMSELFNRYGYRERGGLLRSDAEAIEAELDALRS